MKYLFWNDKCVPPAPLMGQVYSNSWKKPRLFREMVQPIGGYQEVVASPVSRATLMTVHFPDFVDGILAGSIADGFGVASAEVSDSFRYTVGMMTGAVTKVIGTKDSACAPVSGFHHADFYTAQGFCTFNGLAVAAVKAVKEGAKVGIFDADQHWGDGTDQIINHFGLSHKIEHWSTGEIYRDAASAKGFIKGLPDTLYRKFRDVDVLIYQAGADCHVDDPLGGWMTSSQMEERDRLVFEFCEARGTPYVWNLAGGYQEPYSKTLKLHQNTFEVWVQ